MYYGVFNSIAFMLSNRQPEELYGGTKYLRTPYIHDIYSQSFSFSCN